LRYFEINIQLYSMIRLRYFEINIQLYSMINDKIRTNYLILVFFLN